MTTFRLGLFAVLLPVVAATTPSTASAHAPRQAYMFLRLHRDSAVVKLEFLVRDLERALRLGWGTTSRPAPDRVREKLAVIRAYAESHFAIGVGDARATAVY